MGRLHLLQLVLLAALGVACARERIVPSPEYLAEIERRRADRLDDLRDESGWLTLVGIHWLSPGMTRIGRGGSADLALPEGDGDRSVSAEIELKGDGVPIFRALDGTRATLRGVAVTETTLRSDRSGPPDIVELGGLRLSLIERGGSLAVRVRDPMSLRRTAFRGLDYFPVDPLFRIEATLDRYAVPREVSVASAQGPAQRMLAPGILRFRIGENACTLEPFVESPDAGALFIVFADETSGRTTYGAGRFLDAVVPEPGSTTVELDFNLAYSPPCAFTPHATCPLPPAANVLAIPVEAGEKDPELH